MSVSKVKLPEERSGDRYIVSDIGYAFAIHDKGSPIEYPTEESPLKTDVPASRNQFNARIVEIVPTRAEAQRIADKMNGS